MEYTTTEHDWVNLIISLQNMIRSTIIPFNDGIHQYKTQLGQHNYSTQWWNTPVRNMTEST